MLLRKRCPATELATAFPFCLHGSYQPFLQRLKSGVLDFATGDDHVVVTGLKRCLPDGRPQPSFDSVTSGRRADRSTNYQTDLDHPRRSHV